MPDTYDVLTHAIAHGWDPEVAQEDFDLDAYLDDQGGDE